MASKLQNISALSNEIGKSLADYENWTAFLKSAAWQYKYPFQDQILIYAQRPDATACASIDVWNKKLKAWINRGSKGIALLREGDRGKYLDYVFDISDTHTSGSPIRLWQYNSRFDNAIIETLENSFGELKSKNSITDAIISAAQNAVEDSKSDYLSELKYAKENSFLDGLDELNIDVEFQQTAETSIAYTVLQRLGINADEVFEREDFPHIMNFNTIPALSVLGNAVSSISEETLRGISETIRAEVREEIQNRKNFAENKNAVYNESKENTPTKINERTDSYDRDNIHGSERIPDSELDNGTDGSTDRQIRADEAEISQTTPTEPIHEPDDNGQNNGASAGGTDISDRTDTDDSEKVGTDRGRERGTESERSDEMDGVNEQPFTFGRGNRNSGGSLQLSLFDLIPTEEQQRETVQRAAHEIFGAAFSMPRQIIDEVLCDGTNDKDSVIETCIEFSKDKSVENKAEFLKNLYKTDGKGFIFDGRKVSAWWNADGIRISYGDSANKNTAQLISWEDAAKRIDELLDLGRFAPKDTLLQMDKYERKKAADAVWEMRRNLNTEDYPELKEYFTADVFSFVGGYPEETDKIAEHLKTSAGLDEIKSVTQKLSDLYDENLDITRYEWYNPHKTNNVVAELYITRKTFTAQELTYSPPERFISRDEIDNMFKRGSGVSEGKYRIYTFFDTHTDKKERITFLKNEYGWGGSYTGLYNENHDAKGITFSHEDLTKPYAKIQISWSEAEKHIDRLIKSRNYLNEAEIKNIPNYEKEELILKIRQAYMYDTDENTIMPYPSDADYYKTKDILMQKLNNKVQTQTMLTDLKNLLAETSADLRSYPLRRAAVQDLEQYANGEYNLFPHIDRIEEVKEETPEEQLAEMSEDERQELVDKVELSLDYSENYNLTDNDMALYRAITKERGEKQFETAKNLINEFCLEEYDSPADFSNLSKIGIAYTTVTDDELPIQVDVNLENFTVEKYIDNVLVDTEYYYNLSNITEKFLQNLNFDELVYVTEQQIETAINAQPQEQPLSEYLAELHKEDNGSKTVAVIPLGDFYEVYGDDAQKAASVLDIAVISKEIDGTRYPMCGFPKHITDEYVNKLLYAGYDVVIADEDRSYKRLLSADKVIPEQAQQTENEPKQTETPPTEVQTSEPMETAESLVGTELTIDDRKFIVDSVNTDFNKVSLKDITFQNSTGFPIFRSESIDFVKSIIAEQAKPQLTAEFQKAKPQRVQNTVVYPEIPLSERHNFQITDDELGYGTPKEKFKRNVAAINLLHELEFEHRLATPEEQEILSQYVGWGGLADAFDESKENWSEEFKELYTTLSPDEYEQARASTLTAHFTPPVVIKAMYKALSNMGFTQGNILEPSCGIGNFMGLLPESMSDSKMYGVEIDSITGRIAGQLYQKNSVAIQGYENSELPDSFFDVAIGNVPFGDFKLLDKKYNKHNFLIHDYFFCENFG